MELKDEVMYATPDGVLFTKENLDRVATVVGKCMEKCVDYLKAIAKEFLGWVEEKWDRLKGLANEALESLEKVEEQKKVKALWNVPKNIKMKHQVMDRKPKFMQIRNHI